MLRKTKLGPYSRQIIAAARAVLAQHPDGLALLDLTRAIRDGNDFEPNAHQVKSAVSRAHQVEFKDLKYKLKT